MSNINKQALREAAEKATPGEWWIDSHGMAMVAHHNDNTMIVFVTDGEQMGKAIRHEDTGNLSHWRNDNDASFIAAANPATVLALLDELEAKDKRIAELELRLSQQQSIAANNLDMFRRADARVSELEAREVKIPELKMLRDYLAEVTHREREDILLGVRLEFHRELVAAGIITKVGE